jgi:hypothetical protein
MNKKSEQGIALIWLILAGVLLVTGMGMVLSKKEAKIIKEQKVSQPGQIKKETREEGEVFVGKVSELIKIGVPLKCSYTQGGFTGVSFVKDKKMYSEVGSKEGTTTYYSIIKDNCMWSWGWTKNQGIKMCPGGNIWETTEALSVEAEYHCSPVFFFDSQFEPPADINFIVAGETAPISDDDLLKILPPKERGELESAIRETQEVLQNIEVFDYTPPSIDDITKGLNQINKQAQEQIQQNIQKQQQFQPPQVDPKKIEEYFKQNPPAVPGGKSIYEQQLEEFEKETGIDLDAPYGDCPNCK